METGRFMGLKNSLPLICCPYDDLYGQMDFKNFPFGYNKDYAVWRKSQINRRVAFSLRAGSVLDDGGGYGFLKEFLEIKKNVYFNLDCSYEILKYDNSEFRFLGDGEALPFKNEVFDNVVSGDVLEHVNDKVGYLREAYRVLKRDGLFILNTPREDWVDSFQKSIWFWIPYLSVFWNKIKGIPGSLGFKKSLHVPKGVIDIPSDEMWLRNQLESIGYEIIEQARTDNHLFGFTGFFWRRLADIFIDARKYGHCVFFVCRKK